MQRKTLSLSECEIKLAGDTARFSGYASTFGGVDQGGDTILKGAYAETLAEHGLPKMHLQHEYYDLPIGKWVSATEDDKGLLVEGEFTPGMTRAAETRAALKHGTVDGLSIGYMLKPGDYEETKTGRVIRSVSMLKEISIVTYPMDLAARVDLGSVKSEIDELQTIRDFEAFLREAGGLSKSVVSALTNRVKYILRGELAEDTEAEKALAVLTTRLQKIALIR